MRRSSSAILFGVLALSCVILIAPDGLFALYLILLFFVASLLVIILGFGLRYLERGAS